MDQLELAYLAGVIDSDGSITIGVDKCNRGGCGNPGTHPKFFEIVAVRQCDTEAIDLAQKLFGGNVAIGKPGSLRGRPSYDWVAYGPRACTVVETLLPYLRIKRKQAELVLALREIKNRGREANTYLDETPIMVRGRYGNMRPLRRRFLKPEVLAEYKSLVLQIRSMNDSRLRNPFSDSVGIVEIS